MAQREERRAKQQGKRPPNTNETKSHEFIHNEKKQPLLPPPSPPFI
jgi:hypothetical protein